MVVGRFSECSAVPLRSPAASASKTRRSEVVIATVPSSVGTIRNDLLRNGRGSPIMPVSVRSRRRLRTEVRRDGS